MTAIGVIGTTIAPWMQFYIQSAVVEKRVTIKDYGHSRLDVISGCSITDIIAFFIIVASARSARDGRQARRRVRRTAAYYKLKDFTDEEALMNVRRLQKNPGIWLHEMVRDEFGIDLREAENGGLRPVFAMAGSFAIGALLPVLSYLLPLPLGTALWL